MAASHAFGRILSGAKYGVLLYLEILLWMVVLGAIGPWFSRAFGV